MYPPSARSFTLMPVLFVPVLFVLILFSTGCPDDPSMPEADAGVDVPSSGDRSWQPAFDATDIGAFMSIWGHSASDVYTVGGQPDDGVVYHFDGESWTPVTVPAGAMLYWVHGVAGETWVVGAEGRILHAGVDRVFANEESGTDVPLWGIWAESTDNVWAVGGDPLDMEAGPVLLHNTGTGWNVAELPELDRSSRALFKVWGTSASDVVAVGARGVAIEFDGVNWTQAETGTGEDLISLWGDSMGNLHVAGGRANAVLARRVSGSWEAQTLVGLPGMNGVWVDSQDVARLAGVRGGLARVPAGTWEFEEEETNTTLVLHAIWGDAQDGPRFTVGGSLNSSPPYTGVVLVSQ